MRRDLGSLAQSRLFQEGSVGSALSMMTSVGSEDGA